MNRLRAILRLTPLLLLGIPPATPVVANDGDAPETHVLEDRLVAVVNDDPILLSDIKRTIGLGLVEEVPGESRSQLERRVLDSLIDERLRLHEIERHNFAPLPPDEIDRQLERIRASFETPDELSAQLAALGLDMDGLRLLVARQLRVLVYVEQRLGPRIFVRLEDISAYYENVLTPEMATQDLEPPPLEDVRDQIRELLHEQQLNQEIDSWTEELRLAADIADYLDRGKTELPPVVQRIEY